MDSSDDGTNKKTTVIFDGVNGDYEDQLAAQLFMQKIQNDPQILQAIQVLGVAEKIMTPILIMISQVPDNKAGLQLPAHLWPKNIIEQRNKDFHEMSERFKEFRTSTNWSVQDILDCYAVYMKYHDVFVEVAKHLFTESEIRATVRGDLVQAQYAELFRQFDAPNIAWLLTPEKLRPVNFKKIKFH